MVNQIILEKIINIARYYNKPVFMTIDKYASTMSKSTDLVVDLNLYGELAIDFLEEYQKTFPDLQLDIGGGDFDFHAYFKSGISAYMFWTDAAKRDKEKKQRITLGMLEQAAIDGIWNSNKLSMG
jgi:hypothetical protein